MTENGNDELQRALAESELKLMAAQAYILEHLPALPKSRAVSVLSGILAEGGQVVGETAVKLHILEEVDFSEAAEEAEEHYRIGCAIVAHTLEELLPILQAVIDRLRSDD